MIPRDFASVAGDSSLNGVYGRSSLTVKASPEL